MLKDIKTIIGLGSAGCRIIENLSIINNNYKFIRINETKFLKMENVIDIQIPVAYSHEEYEKNIEQFPIKLSKIKKNEEILFVLSGAGKISGTTLRILEKLKKCKINVLYICPDSKKLPLKNKLHHNLVFNVLQEYARSGLIERLFLISNKEIENILDGISIVNYYQKINKIVSETINFLIDISNIEPVSKLENDIPIAVRIYTIGSLDFKDLLNDHDFYILNDTTDVIYFFLINKEQLKEDVHIMTKIEKILDKKLISNIRVSYSIYETENENSCFYIKGTSIIQKETNI